jgi:hypothetical protein
MERLKFGTLIDAGNWYTQVVLSHEVGWKLRCYDIKDKRYIVYKKNEYRFWELGLQVIWEHNVEFIDKLINN